ncbi:MAG: hypothetical protein DI536_34550 [Archangium gephyra]|uniref:Uncharacterized protein n=1 Tax=Archangium gephyra TaxID=48 RepID=A0A2W5U658_9BACT|nr:MAG: hypothetical protein DI536_34550 [Archangium gephyra]
MWTGTRFGERLKEVEGLAGKRSVLLEFDRGGPGVVVRLSSNQVSTAIRFRDRGRVLVWLESQPTDRRPSTVCCAKEQGFPDRLHLASW